MKKYLEGIEMLMRDIDLLDFEDSVRRYAAAKIVSEELSLQMEGNEDLRYHLQKLTLSMTLFREAVFGENEGCQSAQDRMDSARINLNKVKGGLHE